MTSPTQKKQRAIEDDLHNQVITRVIYDIEPRGQRPGSPRKHLRLDFEGGATVLITGTFSILYNDRDAQPGDF